MVRIVSILVVASLAGQASPPDPCPALAGRVGPGGASAEASVSRTLTAEFCRELIASGALGADEAASVTDGATLLRLASSRSGKDALDLGAGMLARQERAARTVSTPLLEHRTAHYILLAAAGTAAARDLALIADEAERCRQGLARAFRLDDALTARQPLLRATVPSGVAAEGLDGRIAIHLFPTRDAAAGKAGRSYGGATFGATIGEDGRARLTLAIHVVYLGPFSLAVVQHEVAHLAVMLAAFDATALAQPVKGEDDLRRAFMAGYRRIPAFVSEGIADYGLYYEGVYSRWGLLGPVRSLAAARDGDLPPVRELLASDARFHAQHHKVFSLGAATFIRFLTEGFGEAPVRDWLLASDQADRFRSRFGMDLDEADRRWRTWLRASPGRVGGVRACCRPRASARANARSSRADVPAGP